MSTTTIDRITQRHAAGRERAVGRTRLVATPALGWYGGVVLALAFASFNFGSNPAWLLVFLLLGTVVAGTMQAWRRIAGLGFSHGSIQPVPAGRPASLPVKIANPGHRPAFGVMVVPRAAAAAGTDRHIFLAAYIPPRGDHSGDLLLPPLPRGIHSLPELLVAVRWPLGLVQAERRWKPLGEIIVHPAPKGRSLEESHPQSRPLGEPSDGRGRDGDDFDGLRPYRPGDSPRHVHWKSAARGTAGDPPVKVFAGSEAGELVLAYDDCTGDPETRLSQLARWIDDAFSSGRRYALSLPGTDLPPGEGEGHRLSCLRLLARWQVPKAPAASGSGRHPTGKHPAAKQGAAKQGTGMQGSGKQPSGKHPAKRGGP